MLSKLILFLIILGKLLQQISNEEESKKENIKTLKKVLTK